MLYTIHCENTNHQLVAGGPCICFAKGNPLRLTLQDLIDIYIPYIIAAEKKIPLYIYYQTYESDMMSIVTGFDKTKTNYSLMKHYLEIGLNYLIQLYDLSSVNVYWIDTSDQTVKTIIDKLVETQRAFILDNKLYGLYGKQKGSDYPCGTAEENLMLEVYRRNIAIYRPEFYDNINVKINNIDSILFVENVNQEHAIRIANNDNEVIEIMTYKPAPNRQGAEMVLGNRNHKLELRSTKEQIKSRSKPYENHLFEFNDYYNKIFKDKNIEQIMTDWQYEIKK
jgi:hypothetical protein